MNSVERVRSICKDRKIPISRLEKDLGFANGYISQLRKGVFPADRLATIADYLGTTTEYLLTGLGEKEIAPVLEDEREAENPDIRMIARAGRKMTPEQAENLRKYAQYMFPEAFEE